MTRRSILLALLLLAPTTVHAQSAGERLRGGGEGALIGAVLGAGVWGPYCAVAEPDDDIDGPMCAVWGAVYHAPLGFVAGLGLASENASTLGGRLLVVGLGAAAGAGAGALVAAAGGDDFANAMVGFGAMGAATGIAVAAVGPWLHRRFGHPVTVAPTRTGFAARVGVR